MQRFEVVFASPAAVEDEVPRRGGQEDGNSYRAVLDTGQLPAIPAYAKITGIIDV